MMKSYWDFFLWTSYQMCEIAGCACAGNAGNVSPPPLVSDPDMHHDTCVTHVPWCMPGSLTSRFLWSQWRGKRFRHSRRMRNPSLYVSGKRPMQRIRYCVILWLSVSIHFAVQFWTNTRPQRHDFSAAANIFNKFHLYTLLVTMGVFLINNNSWNSYNIRVVFRPCLLLYFIQTSRIYGNSLAANQTLDIIGFNHSLVRSQYKDAAKINIRW